MHVKELKISRTDIKWLQECVPHPESISRMAPEGNNQGMVEESTQVREKGTVEGTFLGGGLGEGN